MTLELFPKPCPCPKHGNKSRWPEGTIHAAGQWCPLREEGDRYYEVTPGGLPLTCCWSSGDVAVLNLEAIDRPSLARRVSHDMTCDEARLFAYTIMGVRNDLAERHDAGRRDLPMGPGWIVCWDADTGRWEPAALDLRFDMDDTLTYLDSLADWYRCVALAGCGVAVKS
jgi:hypothetical protein